jgi:hypothetical protein
MKKRIFRLYHEIVSVLILLKYKDLDKAKEKSFDYYVRNVCKK